MNDMHRWNVAWLLLPLLVGGCDAERGGELPAARGAPIALEDALLYVGSEPGGDDNLAMLADLSGKQPRVTLRGLGPGELQMIERPGQAKPEALLLTSGQAARLEDGEPRDAVPARLTRVDHEGERARYLLSGRLDRLTVSDDGRYVIAYGPGDAFQLELAIAVVDLSKAPETPGATALFSLDATTGESPGSFVLSPEGVGRPLAVAPLRDTLLILDLSHPELGPVSVPLALSSQGAALVPKEILFTEDRIYARTERSNNVFVVQLDDEPGSARGFRPTVSQIPVGKPIVDLALGEEESLVVLTEGGLVAYDREALETFSIGFDARFGEVRLFAGRSPFDDALRQRALLSGFDTRLGFVDLSLGEQPAAQEVEYIDLLDAPIQVQILSERPRAVVSHNSGRISLVDLEQRTVSPVGTGEAPERTFLDEARERLWIATSAGRVGSIDLNTLIGGEILLEARTVDLLLVPGKTPRMALVHPSSSGHVTLVDAAKPARDGARELLGFLWTGLFD